MCSNYQSIKNHRNEWVKHHFGCELPSTDWREEIYPTYASPFVYLKDGKPHCELAQFGLVPHWAQDKKKFGLKTYNARSETVHEKPSYRMAWKERRFGLVLVESFYEPCYESGKAVRWRIKRTDAEPTAIASIWEQFVDKETGEFFFSFSMLTINADGHDIMKHFHKPEDEKRSVVILQDDQYQDWLNASHQSAKSLLKLTPIDLIKSEPAPR